MSTINNTMKILSSALILFTLPFVTSSIAIADNAPNPYSIGGVRIQMTEKQVLNLLGKPSSRSTGRILCGDNRFIQLNYPRGKIILEEYIAKNNFYVITVETKVRGWSTEKVIKVGDNISKAKNLYSFGAGKIYGGEWQVQRKINRPGILRFKTNSQQKIISIDLESSYDC
jgi:hypothetical protein